MVTEQWHRLNGEVVKLFEELLSSPNMDPGKQTYAAMPEQGGVEPDDLKKSLPSSSIL